MFRDCLLKKYISLNGKTINNELARGIVEEMSITDGSDRRNGERFTLEQAEEIGKKLYINFTRVLLSEWYLVLNYCYKKYYRTAEKYNQADNELFYGDIAKAWFEEVDAPEDRIFNFFLNN